MPRKKTAFMQFGNRTIPTDDQPELIKQIFANVSSRYDLMNDLMSVGTHRFWKDALVDWLAPRSHTKCLDLAGGTGDIARRILKRSSSVQCSIVDLTHEMLWVGRNKIHHQSDQDHLNWIAGDASKLPFSDNLFDYCTIGFGMRNFKDIDQSLAEIMRVLKRGGRLLILEFSHVKNAHLSQLYDAYSFKLIPKLGNLVVKDQESYQYLVDSIRNFPTQEEFAERLQIAGFKQVKYRNLSLGVVAIHSGWKL